MRFRIPIPALLLVGSCGGDLASVPLGWHDARSECAQWCGVREPKVEDGFCAMRDGNSGGDSCVEACENLASEENAALVRRCVEDDPLCFINLDGCIAHHERVLNCDTWCTDRSGGMCAVSEGAVNEDCSDVCYSVLNQPLPAHAVESCLRDDPLCYQTLRSCAETATAHTP